MACLFPRCATLLQSSPLNFKKILILFVLLLLPVPAWAVYYDVPADRRTTWNAGLDPVGGIPNYPSIICAAVHGDGVTEDSAIIQNCINAASPNTAVYLPAGTYKVSSSLNLKSNIVLRGAGSGPPWLPSSSSGTTTLVLYGSSTVRIAGNGKSGWGSGVDITSGYSKGSTSLTLSSVSGLSIGNTIAIFEDNNANYIKNNGCNWCGPEESGQHVLGEFSKITSINGNTIGLNHPIHYVTPGFTGNQIRKTPMTISYAGIEDIKIRRNDTNEDVIRLYGAEYCWVKNVETYNCGGANANAHIDITYCYACEIRDNYCHTGMGHGSGQNYGIWLSGWNSDHKIENNIVRDTRHAINFEGGGVGCAILYNYTMDNWESDTSCLTADLNSNHGPHPCMNLLEGNYSTNIISDYQFGSSSYYTLFRNYARAKRDTPSGYTWGRWGIGVEMWNRYYNLLGNVVGEPSWTSGTVLANAANQYNAQEPVAFRFGFIAGGGSGWESNAYDTALFHGNYDYITKGVASWGWQGGSDYNLRDSIYYTSKPSWYGGCIWPPIGPDVSGHFNSIPAKLRYEGSSCPETGEPLPPTNLRILQQ